MIRLLAAALILAAALAYWYWTTTPEYSLIQAVHAVKSRNKPAFEKYVEVDGVAESIVQALVAEPVGEAAGSFGLLSRAIGLGLFSLFKPELTKQVKAAILSLVKGQPEGRASAVQAPEAEDGMSLEDAQDKPRGKFSLRALLRQLGFRDKIYNGFAFSRKQGNHALLGIKMHNSKYNRDITLEIKLRKLDGYWQVVELTNLPDFLATLLELERGQDRAPEKAGGPLSQLAYGLLAGANP